VNRAEREVAADRQRRAARQGAVGLSAPHNSPAPPVEPVSLLEVHPPVFALDADGYTARPSIEIALGGEYGAVHLPRPVDMPRGGGRRGRVREYSPASRRRMQRRLASIDRRALSGKPLFVTLTYPATWPKDGRTWKTHLDTFLKRLKRLVPHAAAIWKLEFQKRGAPHFHLLVFGCAYLSHRWVARAWNAVAAPGDKAHLKAGTEVTRVKTWRGVAWYAAKYMSKVESVETHSWTGRYWGVHNRACLPVDVFQVTLSWAQAYQLRRVFFRKLDKRHAGPRRRGQWAGASIFMGWADLLRLLADLP